jgi:hypothetical protein
MNKSKQQERWIKAKELYTQGRQTADGLKYPTYDEIAGELGLKAQTIRVKSSKENWTLQRKQFVAKVENLTSEKKSIVMAGESVEFDSQCLSIALKGLRLVDRELEALMKDAPDFLTAEDTLKWIFGRIDGITKYGKALNDYQKAGRLAFGEASEKPETPQINIKVISEKGKTLTENLLTGDLDI